MASEMDKLGRRARLWGLTVVGMTMGIWDMVEDAAVTMSPMIGMALLGFMQKDTGLELAGTPEQVLTELGRIFVDEMAFGSEAKLEVSGNTYKLTIMNAVGTPEFKMMQDKGVKKLFSNPLLVTGLAALKKINVKAHANLIVDVDAKTQTAVYEIVN